jgi:peptidoglycan/xylan/chitin deacetylase (PgdA/CDA1 family)
MDKRVIQQRMKKKRRQLRRRKLMRLVSCVLGALLVVVLIFNFIISPLARKISGSSGTSVEVQAGTQEKDPTQAVRVPVKDQNNASKALSLTAGWQEDANGRWYQNVDGTYYADGLVEIDGKTYYVDENGYVQTGWVSINGEDYMFDEDGVYDPTQERPMIALTFDDGPGAYTMDLLECLEENNAHATFFMVGSNAENYPEEIQKMQEIGCELGNHSYDHQQLTTLENDGVVQEFQTTSDIIKSACGSAPTVARTPYGDQNEDITTATGLPCILWSIDTLDWQTRNADTTYTTTMDSVSDGDIVLMHDIHQETVEAAKRLIPDLIAKGYKLVTVSELAQAKGITMEVGTSYTNFYSSTVAALSATDTGDSSDDSQEDTYEDQSQEDESQDEDSQDDGDDSENE